MLFGITKTMKEITHAEREIMSELSSVVALAIERAQIYTDLKSAIEYAKRWKAKHP
jgi:GAF domain-containing protein